MKNGCIKTCWMYIFIVTSTFVQDVLFVVALFLDSQIQTFLSLMGQQVPTSPRDDYKQEVSCLTFTGKMNCQITPLLCVCFSSLEVVSLGYCSHAAALDSFPPCSRSDSATIAHQWLCSLSHSQTVALDVFVLVVRSWLPQQQFQALGSESGVQ